jgi:phosphatidylserine/phosphatidylglycerophosphate/cardiolipin synthase-like enzyme
MVHAKLILVDEKFVTFGSTNLNKLAMHKLGELNVSLKMSEPMTSQLKKTIDDEIENSIYIESYKGLRYSKIKATAEIPFV